MKFIKKLLNTTTKKIVVIGLIAILLLWIVLFFVARGMAIASIVPLLWTLLAVALAWISIHFGLKAWRKRKRAAFDEEVAAKEGIEDRRREWATWTDELEKQGIDRYELPFYLLVGEPQSGKSVMLHNSDLHFPFGQTRLSGVGGTRGCDWWFTEEAVILDLAGRLFTHEGGAADRLEFEAFLQLLYEFRPLCPVNGVILVVPCDSLLKDGADQCAAKATKLQNALASLTSKLQAQLPVYLVLTKGDQVFGFAESVHRLDVDHRHQMFGWSRPAEKIDSPFDVAEVQQGFDGMVERARLLRAQMLAGARLPEALPEVDRLYAFPHELEGLRSNLEVYLKRIFTSSNVTDRVFFRGLYLTSGLQSGVPIAKVCTDLFGQTGEADTRNLEALFSKQRAYFIKDLIRQRIFGERGLVRPTQGRVQAARRTSAVAYSISGAVVLASVLFAVGYTFREVDAQELRIDEVAVEAAEEALDAESLEMPDLLYRLQLASDAVERERHAYEQAYTDTRDDYRALYCRIFDRYAVPKVRELALEEVEARLARGLESHADLIEVVKAATVLVGDVDFSDTGGLLDEGDRGMVLAVLSPFFSGRNTVAETPPLDLLRAFELRDSYGSERGLVATASPAEAGRLSSLCRRAVEEIETCLEPGGPTQPTGVFGYALAWKGAEDQYLKLTASDLLNSRSGDIFDRCRIFSNSLKRMEALERELQGGEIPMKGVLEGSFFLKGRREKLASRLEQLGGPAVDASAWPDVQLLLDWFTNKFQSVGKAGSLNLSAFGAHFGSEDLGQTLFQMSESQIGLVTGAITIGADVKPIEDLTDIRGLRGVCDERLPSELLGGLAGLGRKIEELDSVVLGATASRQAQNVFIAQCIELALQAEALPDAASARAALAEDDTQRALSLSVGLLSELVSLHGALGTVAEGRDLRDANLLAFRDWQERAEELLRDHLEAARSPRESVPELPAEGTLSPEAWNLLEALERCIALSPVRRERSRLADKAGEVQAECFLELGERLLDRWRDRVRDAGETRRTVEELRELVLGVQDRLSGGKQIAGNDFDAWAGRVDELLAERLGALAVGIREIWSVDVMGSDDLRQAVDLALDELADVADKIEASEDAGLSSADIAPILEALSEKGEVELWLTPTSTVEVLADLRQWSVPRKESEVEEDREFRALKSALERLRELDEVRDGPKLASEYAGRFRPPADEKPAANAGIRLVRQVRDQFSARLRDVVRERYLEALRERIDGELFEVLFWDVREEFPDTRDADVLGYLDKLLKKDGEFDQGQKEYMLTGAAASIGTDLFPAEPAPGEGEWGAVHRFLADLQMFLLQGGAKRVAGAKLSFWLEPDLGPAATVWNEEGERLQSNFFYPGDDSKEELEREPVLKMMDEVKVSNWGLEVRSHEPAFLLVWSDRSSVRPDDPGYRFELPSSLGPLLLAWSGTCLDEEAREEFRVELEPERASLKAPLKIRFENPLPLRPQRPGS